MSGPNQGWNPDGTPKADADEQPSDSSQQAELSRPAAELSRPATGLPEPAAGLPRLRATAYARSDADATALPGP